MLLCFSWGRWGGGGGGTRVSEFFTKNPNLKKNIFFTKNPHLKYFFLRGVGGGGELV